MIHETAFIHPKAHVTDVCSIGAGTYVWQFASVIRRAKVGIFCRIATCSIIDASTVGDRCIVSHGAFIDPGMQIGNDCFIGPHVAFCNDFWPRVSKDDFDMLPLLIGSKTITIVDNGASIGANATILPGLLIGAKAMIAAGAVVDRDVPAFHLFKRDGSIVPIDEDRPIRRMRAACLRDVMAAE